MKAIIKLIKKVFNTDMGYQVIEYPYIYEGLYCVGYVIIKPYIMFGLYGYDRITHFSCKETLDRFLSDVFVLDSQNFLVPLQ
jgi:hypothetical protein